MNCWSSHPQPKIMHWLHILSLLHLFWVLIFRPLQRTRANQLVGRYVCRFSCHVFSNFFVASGTSKSISVKKK
jgi:hypothetical protein